MKKTTKLRSDYFNSPARRPSGKYIQAGKVRMYYESYGRGTPLLLLHGGLSAIEGLRYQIPFFSKYYQVILPERPGHGRTEDMRGAYTYEAMARQTAAFMDALRLKKALWMGYSDGANLIYWLAAKRKDLVRCFVSVGGNYHYRGCEPRFQKMLKQQAVELDPRYAAVSPDGEAHYPVVFEKCRKLWLSQPRWKKTMLKTITAPALVVAGDRDMIQHEHTLSLFRALPCADLAVIPGTSHGLLKEKPRLINSLMLHFFRQHAQRS